MCMKKIILPLFLIFVFFQSSPGSDSYITLASTTSTENSGLLSYLLPFFEKKTGISVRVLTKGTGQALELGRRGDVDVVFVHAEILEKKFVSNGFGLKRYPVMYNDFVVLGPSYNPAAILSYDSVESAFQKIFNTRSVFVSRGDNSGTHLKERQIWNKVGLDMSSKSWDLYKEVGSGMGTTLNIAVALNGYTLADRATWKTFSNKGNMKIILEGDPILFNQYGVILINPKLHPHVKKDRGQIFINWLISKDGQNLISTYLSNNEHLFFPNYESKN